MISKRFTLNRQEAEKWATNAAVFLFPVLMIYLSYVIGQIPDPSRFSWGVLVPNQFVTGSMVLYVLNTLYDFLRKWMAGR
jgi:aromatic ring-opening dioxygenase LigB subunit